MVCSCTVKVLKIHINRNGFDDEKSVVITWVNRGIQSFCYIHLNSTVYTHDFHFECVFVCIFHVDSVSWIMWIRACWRLKEAVIGHH